MRIFIKTTKLSSESLILADVFDEEKSGGVTLKKKGLPSSSSPDDILGDRAVDSRVNWLLNNKFLMFNEYAI